MFNFKIFHLNTTSHDDAMENSRLFTETTNQAENVTDVAAKDAENIAGEALYNADNIVSISEEQALGMSVESMMETMNALDEFQAISSTFDDVSSYDSHVDHFHNEDNSTMLDDMMYGMNSFDMGMENDFGMDSYNDNMDYGSMDFDNMGFDCGFNDFGI